MLSSWNLIILIVYAAGMAASWGLVRPIAWLCLGAASYLACVMWWKTGMPHAELFTGLCDAGICFAVYRFGKRKWELVVWTVFQASLLADILFLADNLFSLRLADALSYTVILELLNIVAVVWIGITASMEKAGFGDGWAFDPWRTVFGLVLPSWSKAGANEKAGR